MLKVEFPLTVQDTVATYEIPYGSINAQQKEIQNGIKQDLKFRQSAGQMFRTMVTELVF